MEVRRCEVLSAYEQHILLTSNRYLGYYTKRCLTTVFDSMYFAAHLLQEQFQPGTHFLQTLQRPTR